MQRGSSPEVQSGRDQNRRERWIPTSCHMCYNACPILVHVVDGVVVNIEGNPASIQSMGKMCAKGKAGVMNLYNPNRVVVPMMRTNPKKGIGLDAGFAEITWKQALDTISEQLGKIRQEDPKELFVQCWGSGKSLLGLLRLFASAYGTPNVMSALSPSCGKVIHPVENMVTGGFHQEPDLHYCNYLILVGTQLGISTRFNYTHNMKDLADARTRGMKLVVVDPVGFFTAAKADEWVPIKPGTDTAFALAMMNVLLNELNIYDRDFVERRTNGPYLIARNGSYVRDLEKRPTVWDSADGEAKPFDAPDLRSPSLEGEYHVNGEPCVPAFQLLKERVKKYTPENVSAITTIPSQTIRRIAKEFGEAARIGETIKIDGKSYPYRPVAVDWGRGPQGNRHGFWSGWSLKLLNILLGAIEVPGGLHGTGTRGNWPVEWGPVEGPDGLVMGAGQEIGHHVGGGYATRMVTKPVRYDLSELYPVAGHTWTMLPAVIPERERFGLDYGIKAAIFSVGNAFLGAWGDAKVVERAFASIPFTVSFCIERNEVAEMSDVILPSPTYLEDLDIFAQTSFGPEPTGMHDRCYGIRQPVVGPPETVRFPADVLLDLAGTLGILEDFHKLLNLHFKLRDPYRLQVARRYRWEEIVELVARSSFGDERGLEWFKEHGTVSHPVTGDVAYPGPSTKGRVPIYLEHFNRARDSIEKAVANLEEFANWDTSDYYPLPQFPLSDSASQDDGRDLTAVNIKLPFIYGAHEHENPWLDELCESSGYGYGILINKKTAAKRGISDGDWVRVDSRVASARAKAVLTECIHPGVVAIPGHSGHWARGMPRSRGKGISFNSLLPLEYSALDKISTALDHCVSVRVSKE